MAYQPLGVTVKETVDRVYDMLIQHPDGCEFSAKSLGGNKRRVVAILCQRGIVEKTRFYTKNGMRCKYKWAVASKPTKVLYGSITQELRDRQKQWNKTFAEKKRGAKNVQSPAVTDELVGHEPESQANSLDNVDIIHEGPLTPVIDQPVINNLALEKKPNPLEIFGIDELWAEIKRRGCFIEDNQLVLIKKVVFS